ncbi:MAG: DivIVA domain-containing protein [Actinomycetota bacterium]
MRKKKHEEEDAGLQSGPEEGARLTPVDVQQKEFRLAFRGYNERDVDAFLDEVTEELAAVLEENKRLRDGSGAVPSPATLDGTDTVAASRGAEETLARAREEAEAIVREAETRAAMLGGSRAGISAIDTRAVSAFLTKEREFLQSLAGLIQGHAESVKDIAKQARATAPARKAVFEEPQVAEPAASPPPTSLQDPQPRPWTSILDEPKREATDQDTVMIVETSSAPEPTPAPERPADPAERTEQAVAAEPASAGEEGERSLRELFWGED